MKSLAGLFLDRDGVLIEDIGYLCDPAHVRLLPGVKAALARAARHFRLYLVTNQSGIGRGLHTLAAAEACNQRMFELLEVTASAFDGVCIAPEHPDAPSRYRKPSPRYLLERIAADRLDPAISWMVGDRLSDLQAGVAAGIRAALLRQSPHAAAPEALEFVAQHGLPVFATFTEFVDTCLRNI